MTRWKWTSLLGLFLLAWTPCRAQEDLRLYHEALYQEHVAHRPEKALAIYRKICKEFPGSPFRRNALVRQADLLRKLHRPEEAKKILAILSKEGLARQARRDLSRLEKNAGRIKRREALLEKLKGFRKRLNLLQARLNQVRRRGAPKAEVDQLEKQVRNLRKAIESLKPQLTGIQVFPFWVKRQGLVPKKSFREARKLGARILELRRKLQALRAQGKKRERAQVLLELKRTQARLEKIFRSLRAHKREPLGPGRPFFGFPPAFPPPGREIHLLLSPSRLARLDEKSLHALLQGMDRFVGTASNRLQRRGKKDSSLFLRAAWRKARRLYEKHAFREAAARTRLLMGMLFRRRRRFGPPSFPPSPKRKRAGKVSPPKKSPKK